MREGAQSLVEATEARFEGEMFTLQKKLHIATLSPGSPSVRRIFGAAAPEPEPSSAREETPRIGAQMVAEMPAEERKRRVDSWRTQMLNEYMSVGKPPRRNFPGT